VTLVLVNTTHGTARTLLRETVTGLAPIALHVRLQGLKPGHRYRYHVAVRRLDGTTAGATRTFTTRRHR
jgi:phosphodiesterase/alkaline phosphatase D-like protein